MKAEEIRKFDLYTAESSGVTRNVQDVAYVLIELTAQLAELNESIRRIADATQTRLDWEGGERL